MTRRELRNRCGITPVRTRDSPVASYLAEPNPAWEGRSLVMKRSPVRVRPSALKGLHACGALDVPAAMRWRTGTLKPA